MQEIVNSPSTSLGRRGQGIENAVIEPFQVHEAALYASFEDLARDFDLWTLVKFANDRERSEALEKLGLRRMLAQFLADDTWHGARAAAESRRGDLA